LPLPKEPEIFKLPLEKSEIQALIDVCDPTTTLGTRDLALLLLLLDGGLRASELTGLLVGHVNVDEGQIFIASGKGRKSRTVTIGTDAKRMLARYAFFRDAQARTPASADAPFFHNLQGNALQYEALRKWLVRLKRRAGVTRSFLHLLRHTSAVQTLEVPGADLFTLQAKLGHADIATTRRYLRMTREQLSARQRTFSPIDHLCLDGLMRLEALRPSNSNGDTVAGEPVRRSPTALTSSSPPPSSPLSWPRAGRAATLTMNTMLLPGSAPSAPSLRVPGMEYNTRGNTHPMLGGLSIGT
jgi:hypothetical protein